MFGIFRVFLCTSGADESNLADGVKKRLNNTINSIIVYLINRKTEFYELTGFKNPDILSVSILVDLQRGTVWKPKLDPSPHNINLILSLKTHSNLSGFFCFNYVKNDRLKF